MQAEDYTRVLSLRTRGVGVIYAITDFQRMKNEMKKLVCNVVLGVSSKEYISGESVTST